MAINNPFDRAIFLQSVKTTGDSTKLAKGQLAVVDKKTSNGDGSAIVNAFAGYPKDDKRFVIQVGNNGKIVTRSDTDKAMSTPYFSLNEIKRLTANVPSRTKQTVDDVVIGYDGIDATKAFKLVKGQVPFRLRLDLSGGPLDYRGGGTASHEQLEFVKEVPGCDPFENCEECDECETVDCRTFFTELIEDIRTRTVTGGGTVNDLVEVLPVFGCSEEGDPDTTDLTYYTLEVCDTGDSEALNFVQAQYEVPVLRLGRKGSTTTYQVLAASAPADYVQTINSVIKGCADCPADWDTVAGGFVYSIQIEDNGTAYTTQITGALANAKFVSGTLVKTGNEDGKGTYVAVYSSKITQAEIQSFIGSATNNRTTATVAYVGKKQALCSNDDTSEIEWVEGDSCEVTTQKYSIVLPDNECGQSRLAELQASYPAALNIAIAQRIDSYSVEGTITASAGSGVISVGDDDFTITYATSATVTAGNFVTAHGAALLALGITVTNIAGLLTFTAATQALVDSITFTADDVEDDFDVTLADSEADIVDDRQACSTRYEATVVTNMVCEQCDDVFKDFFTSVAPAAYGQAVWTLVAGQDELNKSGECLCGIRFIGRPFLISGDEPTRTSVQFTETSTLIQVSAGYNNLEIREGIGFIPRYDFTGIHRTRFAPRTHLMGNLRRMEQESRAYFNGLNFEPDYVGRILKADESVVQDNLQQLAQVILEIHHQGTQGFGFGHHNNRFVFMVPLGQHTPLVTVMNNLAGAAGVTGVSI
jgi:hypothetical protein